jgi:hypothetical protein
MYRVCWASLWSLAFRTERLDQIASGKILGWARQSLCNDGASQKSARPACALMGATMGVAGTSLVGKKDAAAWHGREQPSSAVATWCSILANARSIFFMRESPFRAACQARLCSCCTGAAT